MTKHRIYLSHTKKDEPLAKALARYLEDRDMSVWKESSLPPGASIHEAIRSELRNSDAMIALLSPRAFSSSWVRHELDHALFDERYKNKLLAVLIGSEGESFDNIPWIVSRMNYIKVYENYTLQKKVETIAKAFLNQIKEAR